MLEDVKLKNYSGNTKQTFLSMLSQFEAEGVSDIRVVRAYIQNSIEKEIIEARKQLIPEKRRARAARKAAPPCPTEGCNGILIDVDLSEKQDIDAGVKVRACKKCRFSEVV